MLTSEQSQADSVEPAERLLLVVCGAAALFFVGALLYITLSRIGYPYALEWLEGTSLLHVERILSGRLIYVEPSLAYVPLSYPPLYYYAGAAGSLLTGRDGFLPLRLVSFGASLASLSLICLLIRSQRGSVAAATLGIASFAAMFRTGAAWFDIARVDMLGVFFMLAAVWLALRRPRFWPIRSGLAIALACLTKQPFVLVMLAMCAYLLVVHRNRQALVFGVVSLGIVAGATLSLDRLHAGWYRFFVFEMPGRHDLLRELPYASRQLWLWTIVQQLPVLALLVVFFLLNFVRARYQEPRHRAATADRGLLATVLAAALAVGWSGLANPGGYPNVLIPLLAMIAVCAGLGMDTVLRTRQVPATPVILTALLALQFALLFPTVGTQIPTDADKAAGDTLVTLIEEQDADVFVPYHPELALFAGKPAYANYIALYELEGGQGGGDDKLWRELRSALQTAIMRRKFSLIILDKTQFWGNPARYYQATEPPLPTEAFYPVVGWRTRPVVVYITSP